MLDGQIWRHFKGGLYTVLTKAVHTETGEDLVVYSDGVKVWARPLAMFASNVEVGGKLVPRFERLLSKEDLARMDCPFPPETGYEDDREDEEIDDHVRPSCPEG